jgi:hypothetical protein
MAPHLSYFMPSAPRAILKSHPAASDTPLLPPESGLLNHLPSASSKVWFSLIAVLVFLGSGCTSLPPPPIPTTPAMSPRASATTTSTSKVLKKTRPAFPLSYFIVRNVVQDGSQPLDDRVVTTYQIHYQYPEFSNPAYGRLNDAIKDLVGRERVRLMNLAGFLDDTALRSPNLPWQSAMSYEIVYATNAFISLALRTVDKVGTQPAKPAIWTFNYDTQGDQLLTVEQCLASADAFVALADKIREQLKAKFADHSDAEQIDRGTEPKKENYQCFSLTPASLIVHFQPDQVAPEKEGILHCQLPWGAVTDLLNPEFRKFWDEVVGRRPAAP